MQQRGRLDHRRTHNTLLINRLLKLHDNASPFMLILDSLAQSSRPLVENIIGKAKARIRVTRHSYKAEKYISRD
jgi:elongator complex protein 5